MVDPSSDLGGRCFVGGSSNAARHLFDVTNLWLAAATLGEEWNEDDVATANATTACCRGRRRWRWQKPMVWLGWVQAESSTQLFASRYCFDGRRKDDQLELSLISISFH